MHLLIGYIPEIMAFMEILIISQLTFKFAVYFAVVLDRLASSRRFARSLSSNVALEIDCDIWLSFSQSHPIFSAFSLARSPKSLANCPRSMSMGPRALNTVTTSPLAGRSVLIKIISYTVMSFCGPLGKSSSDTVKNIYVSDATMVNSTKAAGIKTYPSGGSHGLSTVSNVTWTRVVVEGCDYAIQIQSCYGEDASYCASNPGDAVLTGIVFDQLSGTTSGKYGSVTGNLDCGADGTCGVKVSSYTVKAPNGGTEVLCANTPSSLGVTCASGASG